MREINECTAEVFRLSEKRIKARKRKRKRILAVCIPFCLIITVLSVIVIPQVVPAMRTKESADELGSYIMNSPLACSYIAVEIQGDGIFSEYYDKVTDKAAVTDLFSTVFSFFDETYETGQSSAKPFIADKDSAISGSIESAEKNEDYTYKDKTQLASKLSGYTILFTDEDGSKTEYYLIENILFNADTNEVVILSDAQADELMTALGISE